MDCLLAESSCKQTGIRAPCRDADKGGQPDEIGLCRLPAVHECVVICPGFDAVLSFMLLSVITLRVCILRTC